MSEGGIREESLVSIVVPVYQVLPYLDACVESLTLQTHGNVEIILVDDGSTDGSGDRCEEWARRDERIRVFHTVNRGLSQARNLGIDESRGLYLVFVDSDDVVSRTYVQCLLDALLGHGADIAMTKIAPFVDAPPEFDEECPPALAENAIEALVRIARESRGWEACGKLFRIEAFSGRRFTPDTLYEDLDLIPRLLGSCEVVATLERELYAYRLRDSGIMGASSRRMSVDLLRILDRLILETSSMAQSHRNALTAAYIIHASGRLMTIDARHIRENSQFLAAYRVFVKRHIGEVLSSPEFRVRKRLEVLFCALVPAGMIRAKHFRRLRSVGVRSAFR